MNEWEQLKPDPPKIAEGEWITAEEGNRLIYVLRDRNGQSALDVLLRIESEDFDVTRSHIRAILKEAGLPIESEDFRLASKNVVDQLNELCKQLESLLNNQDIEDCAKSGVWATESPQEVTSCIDQLNKTVQLVRASLL